jgi:hypothetical protein
MIDSYLSELRRIRITLVILTIIIAFTSGNRADDHVVTVDHNNNPAVYNTPQNPNSTMVPLENGHFGILSGNANNGAEEKIKIIYYDQATNQISFKKEIAVTDLFYGMNPQ